MSEEAPRRTFPKKASSFNAKNETQRKKFQEVSAGGAVLERRPKRHFMADLTGGNDNTRPKKRKRKMTEGIKIAKNGKHPRAAPYVKKKKEKGKSVKNTSIDHKMLGESEDEMYASESDIVDVTDMLEDEGAMLIEVPKANSLKKQLPHVANYETQTKNLPEKSEITLGNPTARTARRVQMNNREEGEDLVPSGKKRKKSLSKKRSQDSSVNLSTGDVKEFVEWSTNRGSSRLQLSSDDDSDDVPERAMKGEDVSDDDPETESRKEKRQRKEKRKHDAPVAEETTSEAEAREDNDDEGQEQDPEDAMVATFRSEMADLPLFKVREMKEKLGLRLFNKAYFGTSETKKKLEENRNERMEAKKEEYHGQHRPKEISSKKPVSIFRPVYPSASKKKRDPRFDNRAGEFKERCFDDNYRFLEDLKKQEREELSKEALACDERGETETAERIRETIRRMDNRERTKAEQKMKQETLHELRQENIDRMMRGERPVFKTKAQVKIMNLEKKFKQLKKDNKLDKYMKRKAKKEAHKEAKMKPGFEQKYGYQ